MTVLKTHPKAAPMRHTVSECSVSARIPTRYRDRIYYVYGGLTMTDEKDAVQITAHPGQKVRKFTVSLSATTFYVALGAVSFLIGWALVVYVF